MFKILLFFLPTFVSACIKIDSRVLYRLEIKIKKKNNYNKSVTFYMYINYYYIYKK